MDIITRREWGARHGTGDPDPGPEHRVVIHHSYRPALSPEASPLEEAMAVRSIERYHVEQNGWAGIGYNFLVAPSGRIYEGRGWKFRGAHAGPINGESIGICLLIDGQTTQPRPALIHSVRELIRLGLELREIAPGYQVSGHRDHMAGRTCPGDRVYARLREFRHDAAQPTLIPAPSGELAREAPVHRVPHREPIAIPTPEDFEEAATRRGLDPARALDYLDSAADVLRILELTGVRQVSPVVKLIDTVLEAAER